MSPAVLGIDVGGTTVKSLLLDADGSILGEWREPTPRDDTDGTETVTVIAALVAIARGVAPVDAVGLAVPGEVDDDAGIVLNAVNLGWRDLDIRSLVSAAIGGPVAFGHDVRVGALAEAVAGDEESLVFIPIGTGIASALVTGGVPASRLEWPGEMGQELIASGPLAGLRLEDVASAGGIARRAGLADARAVATLVATGDPVASAIWADAVDALADALVTITEQVSPHTIVIGGGLADAGPLLFDPLEEEFTTRRGEAPRPTIRRASLGDRAAVIGCTLLARRLLESEAR